MAVCELSQLHCQGLLVTGQELRVVGHASDLSTSGAETGRSGI